jgi:hypothetical protein
MTTPDNQVAPQAQEKQNDKEYNFRMLEAKYQRQLDQERAARIEAERLAQERLQQQQSPPEEEEDDDPYVDKKKLKKTLSTFGQNTQSEIQKAMEHAKRQAKEELKQEMWLEQNPDFHDVLSQHAVTLYEKAPQLANTILKMPDNFERQQLVYQNIKHLGLHKPAQQEPSIQQKIDANRRSPFYQPSSVGAAPYSQVGDFSPQGQKQAYEKLQQLKSNLKL